METIELQKHKLREMVYLIDFKTKRVYSYNLEAPLYYGTLEVCEDKTMISKSDGCLAGYYVKYRPDLKEAIERFSHMPTGHPPS
jgi:hypothetical protein